MKKIVLAAVACLPLLGCDGNGEDEEQAPEPYASR